MRPAILKLGGSAITDKSKKCTPNLPVIQSALDQIAEFQGPLVLLHGGGSYAHPFVTQVGLQKGYKGSFQLRFISETELFLDQLTRIIGTGLLLRKRPFVPVRPMSFITLREGEISHSFLEPVERALKLGLVPLIHGDIAFDRTRGCGVVSADKLASFLGKHLKASRVLFGCDVDGVYSQDPKSSARAELLKQVTERDYRSVLRALGRHSGRDATGGMFSKVVAAVELARNGVECFIFNITEGQLLGEALRGHLPRGTRFPPWRRRD